MKSLKEYIGTVNGQLKYKLVYLINTIFGTNSIIEMSEPATKAKTNTLAYKQVTINQEIRIEPMANNHDVIPTYLKLNKVQVRSLYNLVCYSYFDDYKWNNLKNQSMQAEIKSQLGFAMREAISDEYCFPALN